MSQYLSEAFKKLEALNEETFSVSDKGLEEFTEFRDTDEVDEFIDVVDMEAETEADLKDSYIGMVILDCGICHSKQYVDADEVIIDDDAELANVGSPCPYCENGDGFKVIGQIKPFGDAQSDEDDDEDDEKDNEEHEESAVEEGLKRTKKGEAEEYKKVTFADVKKGDFVMDHPNDESAKPEKVIKIERDGDDIDLIFRNGNWSGSANTTCFVFAKADMKTRRANAKQYAKGSQDDYDWLSDENGAYMKRKQQNESIKELGSRPRRKSMQEAVNNSDILAYKDELQKHLEGYDFDLESFKVGSTADGDLTVDVSWGDWKHGHIRMDRLVTNFFKDKGLSVTVDEDVTEDDDSDTYSSIHTYTLSSDRKSMQEAVNNVNVETDDSIVNVSTDENGKVTVSTEPVNAVATGDEVLAPIEPTTRDEIESNVADGEEIEIDLQDFEEDSFNEIGEQYLKKVYENVNSFKTSKVSSINNRLIIEGVISFKSGSNKKTRFVFESNEATKSGMIRFRGKNEQITPSKKAFTLTGRVHNGTFLSEKLNYNYSARDRFGKAQRLYGTVKK